MMLKTLLKKTSQSKVVSLLRLTSVPSNQPLISSSLRFFSTQPPSGEGGAKPEATAQQEAIPAASGEDKGAALKQNMRSGGG